MKGRVKVRGITVNDNGVAERLDKLEDIEKKLEELLNEQKRTAFPWFKRLFGWLAKERTLKIRRK